MKDYIVFDMEANGLLPEVTEVFCLVAKNLTTGTKVSLARDNITKEKILSILNGKLIGHNIIDYDIPLIKKFYRVDLIDILGNESIIDTLILSKTLNPDRELSKGCPTVLFNPITHLNKKIGPHSLEALAYSVGSKKLEIFDWRFFTPEIIARCEGDVDINEKVYYYLLKEAGLTHGDL